MAWQTRRSLVPALVLLAVTLVPGRMSKADDPDAAFASWVNTLYIGAVALREAAEAGAGTDLTDQDLQGLFSPEIQAMRDAVKDRILPPTELEGPILDMLFGWGALPHRRIDVLSVTPDGPDHATVDLTIDGTRRLLVLTGRFNEQGKAWQIDDIDYGEVGPDRTLRGRLKRMQNWPKHGAE